MKPKTTNLIQLIIVVVVIIIVTILFVKFSHASECRLEEALFEQKGKVNEFGGPVFEKLYSCDGRNWFKEPPVTNTVQPIPVPPPPRRTYTPRYYGGYSGSYNRGYGSSYNRGYQGDGWLDTSGSSGYRSSRHRHHRKTGVTYEASVRYHY